MIQGVVIVIERGGRFLVGKRSLHKKAAPGYWCPVSGKIEAGESEEQAVVREVSEETGLDVAPLRKLCSFITSDSSTELHWWIVNEIQPRELRANHEHSELRWVTIEEMRKLQPFFREDLEVFEKLVAS